MSISIAMLSMAVAWKLSSRRDCQVLKGTSSVSTRTMKEHDTMTAGGVIKNQQSVWSQHEIGKRTDSNVRGRSHGTAISPARGRSTETYSSVKVVTTLERAFNLDTSTDCVFSNRTEERRCRNRRLLGRLNVFSKTDCRCRNS